MRKTLGITRILLKSFVRKPVWMTLLSLSVLLAVGCYLKMYPSEPALAVHMTAYAQLLLTLTLMMLGIQLKSEPRQVYFDDVIVASSKQRSFLLRCQLLTVGFVSLTITLAIATGIFLTTLTRAPALWSGQILAYLILLYFIPCCISGVWGLLIAQWSNGRGVYFPAILVWLATSSLATDFSAYFDALGLYGGRVPQSMLGMGVTGMRDIQGIIMMQPIELPRWIVRATILAALVTVLLVDNMRGLAILPAKRRAYGAALLIVSLCGVVLLAYEGCRHETFFKRFADPGVRVEYTREKADEYVSGMPVSLNDFPTEKNIALHKTDIDLRCTTQGIVAQATIEASMTNDATSQSFTLYSDLIVDEVLIDGAVASFERAYDGLLTRFPTAKKSGDSITFCFKYHGYSLPIFPANETTVQLNRAFPWLPWPGIKTALTYGNFYGFSESEDFFIEDWQRKDEVAYTLRYSGPGDLYVNLSGQGEGLYAGLSRTGVELYSGMAHSVYRGVDVYVPGSQYKYAALYADAVLDSYDVLKDLCARMGAVRIPEAPRSITVVEMDSQLILPYPFTYPNELYSWGDEWTIRQSSSSATLLTRMRYGDDAAEYRASLNVRAKMAVSYLLTSCTGYPIDAPHSSTRNFAAWLCAYISVPISDADQVPLYADMLRTECAGRGVDTVNGKSVPETPITNEESAWIDEILRRISEGENFDGTFARLYQRLLRAETITPSEIITALYHNREG